MTSTDSSMFIVHKDEYHTGFHITFKNGWTASVQFGPGNYCSNHLSKKRGIFNSSDCEIAAWDKNGHWYRFNEENDTVKGYCKADEVAEFINMIKSKEE